ncbi:MAG: YpjP family protein [Bacillus sp. (in: Bacteria)]|nr:YpjP family protein [Bacillus sp. (in: firmicutes)]
MNKWLRKSLFVVISILTFGLVTPTQLINPVNAENINDRETFDATAEGNSFALSSGFIDESEHDKDIFIGVLLKQAEIQSYQKFGVKIKPVIEDEFKEIILPNIEKVLDNLAVQFPEEDWKNLSITALPSAGHSEKIFNINNRLTGNDVLRFHVRRDNPPQAGYWFNFHYHTYYDDFHSHHDLGTIFWAKNTPPKWMS